MPLPDDIWQDATLAHKYRLEKTLGTGGMGVVVAARHQELDEPVAIKFLLPEAARSTAALTRFRREARAAAKIKNEHVVRVIDVASTEAGIPYIVMEYLAGRDLERVLQEAHGGQLAISDAIDFVLQASEALAEAHRLGIVHRDLKPANLFCVERGRGFPMIKVLDFGISKLSSPDGDGTKTDRHEILGSPRYMSPEQIDAARDVDARADIWSLGVILYEMIAGQAPFAGSVAPELWRKIRTETPRSLKELRPEIPSALATVVQKCLEKEPARRYGDLGELAKALAPMAPERSRASLERIQWAVGTRSSAREVSVVPLSRDPTSRQARLADARRRRRRMITGAAVVLGSVGLGMVLWQTTGARRDAPVDPTPLNSSAPLPPAQAGTQRTQAVPAGLPPTASHATDDLTRTPTVTPTAATEERSLSATERRRQSGPQPRVGFQATAVPSAPPSALPAAQASAPRPGPSIPWLVDIATNRKK